ncbi:putative NAD(P)H quinone oxidoreductase, PIG3 family [Corynebacterium coyleae]|uniref:NAD(P)H-quinone oxidoreductase n=1 Tax=Corynebacterium coyleae TaxID=53374 RepID=A0ABX8KYG5_9CORY|nr:NAD(P)H-quinone oxidoreductase [Corynebacterium coyleae]QXB19462.1 NAD(P)H-quinone oxidoreductase [Corynebacterium coyleae]WJY78744.1 Phthiocerol synthesis polyketide synthase type I PpsC [Corynebacterium coyleae]SEB56600.1 putative NAD(P)H quinone oxidoreductase, PIG3 family [Corynebacterium coyleae]
MKAITLIDDTNPRSLELTEVDTPQLQDGEVLVRVTAAGVNRGDIVQAEGKYPPPKGESEIIGLECAGVIEDPGTTGHEKGEEVGCLLAGGGYAEYVAVPEGQLTPKPANLTLEETAGVVEAACTVWSNLGMLAGIQEGDNVLIHGGAGGIGSFAIQLCKALGCTVAVTAGSQEKLDYCKGLGADVLINYKEQDFDEELKAWADVILDVVGGPYLEQNIKTLNTDGRLVVIAVQGGPKGTLSLGRMMPRRLSVHATTLRARPRPMKAEIVASTVKNVWPLIESGQIKPNITATFPLADAAKAHDHMDSGDNTGKILLIA